MLNETDLVGIELADVETRTAYAVTAGHELRDPRRSVFVVEKVTFIHSARRGLWWIKTEGRKVKNGWHTQGGYGVDLDTGHIEPDRNTGPAPAWLIDLLANYRENREPVKFFTAAHVPAGSDRFA